MLQALVRQLIYARREDRLPEFRGYAARLDRWVGRPREAVQADDFIGLSTPSALRRLAASAGPAARASCSTRCWAPRAGTCCTST